MSFNNRRLFTVLKTRKSKTKVPRWPGPVEDSGRLRWSHSSPVLIWMGRDWEELAGLFEGQSISHFCVAVTIYSPREKQQKREKTFGGSRFQGASGHSAKVRERAAQLSERWQKVSWVLVTSQWGQGAESITGSRAQTVAVNRDCSLYWTQDQLKDMPPGGSVRGSSGRIH